MERGRGFSDCFGHEVCVGQLPKYPYGRVGDTYVVHSYPSRVNRFTVVMRGVEAHPKEEALSATGDASRRSSRLWDHLVIDEMMTPPLSPPPSTPAATQRPIVLERVPMPLMIGHGAPERWPSKSFRSSTQPSVGAAPPSSYYQRHLLTTTVCLSVRSYQHRLGRGSFCRCFVSYLHHLGVVVVGSKGIRSMRGVKRFGGLGGVRQFG